MGAAEHGATFPLAKKLRREMTHQQLHDYAAGPEKGKPERVAPPTRKIHTEVHAYDFRTRNNLKRGA